ncbi:MAG: hypothetical protein NTU71_08675 [Verrucomicrobia bacterium]|nr:hypothetical protein [Verrucomicrobiota bacterium]
MSASESHSSSVRPSEDAMLGLERLIVGRECNGFDRLPPARKARAFAELVHLGYAYGKVEEVAGQDFPDVSVQRVSSRGRRLLRSSRSSRTTKKGKGLTVLWVFVVLAAALFGCLFLMFKASGN